MDISRRFFSSASSIPRLNFRRSRECVLQYIRKKLRNCVLWLSHFSHSHCAKKLRCLWIAYSIPCRCINNTTQWQTFNMFYCCMFGAHTKKMRRWRWHGIEANERERKTDLATYYNLMALNLIWQGESTLFKFAYCVTICIIGRN